MPACCVQAPSVTTTPSRTRWRRAGSGPAAPESLRQQLIPGLRGCPGFGESGQGPRQWALVQDAEALGGAGEGYVEFGRAPWPVGEIRIGSTTRTASNSRPSSPTPPPRPALCSSPARPSSWPDHDAGAFAAGFVP